MRAVLQSICNFLFYSNLWIGVGAAVQVFLTLRYVFPPGASHHYQDKLALAVGLGTVSFYSWIRYEKLRQQVFDTTTTRAQQLSGHRLHLFIIAVLAAGLAGYLLWPFLGSVQLWLAIVFASVLTIAYVWWPLGRPMRSVHWLKTVLVPLVWVLVVVLLPHLAFGGSSRLVWLMAFERFCFIFAITVPFDLRDAQTDAANGIRTIATHWTNNRPTYFALAVLGVGYLLYLLILYWRWQVNQEAAMPLLVIGTGIYAVSAVLIWFLKKPEHDYWYSGALDGTLILWWLVCFCA